MDGGGAAERPALLELIEPLRWQRLQDHFASVLCVAIRTVSPSSHELLINPCWPSGLAAERAMRLLKMGDELDQLLPLQNPPRDTSTMTTPLGTTYAAVPIRATTEHLLAYLVVGPVVLGRREEAGQFRHRIAAMGLEPEPLWSLLLSVKLYSFSSFRSVLTLLEEVSNTLLELAYQAQQLRAIVPQASRLDQAVVRYYTERLWHSLLDAASTATKAQGGSVMVYDAPSRSFRIAAAEGLSEEIVKTSRVKMGEGLAGLAAQRAEILLVDDRVEDAQLKARMKRPKLVSSLVAPLIPESVTQPLGVLNLRTNDKALRFTPDHVELLRKLTQLAQAALTSLTFLTTRPNPA